jgi:hypothetical protein
MGGAGGFAKGGHVGKMGKEGSAIEERTEPRSEARKEGDKPFGAFAKGGSVGSTGKISTERHGPGKAVASSSGDVKSRHTSPGRYKS